MRIPDNYSNSNLDKYLTGSNSANKSQGISGNSPVPDSATSNGLVQSDSVQISQQAQQITQLNQLVATSPDPMQAKIAQIQNQISNGTYSVDPIQVAKNWSTNRCLIKYCSRLK
ncbi:MAG: flagellar biosynthesis anti-sigma factor FlgM [Nitrospiria bacterium]